MNGLFGIVEWLLLAYIVGMLAVLVAGHILVETTDTRHSVWRRNVGFLAAGIFLLYFWPRLLTETGWLPEAKHRAAPVELTQSQLDAASIIEIMETPGPKMGRY